MLRKLSRNIFLSIAGTFKTPSNGVHILNGHYISRENLPQEVFIQLLEKLSKKSLFITVEEAVGLISKKKEYKNPLIAFTFDDGFYECYSKIAPALEAFNTRGAFFINPGFIEGDEAYRKDFLEKKVLTINKTPMNWDQVKELNKRGHIIGAHTIDHIRLNINNKELLIDQIANCRNIIEEKVGNNCNYFAYPYGQLHDIGEEALKVSCNTFDYIFSGANYKNYFSYNNKIINRRHFEGDWSISHLNYFLSIERTHD